MRSERLLPFLNLFLAALAALAAWAATPAHAQVTSISACELSAPANLAPVANDDQLPWPTSTTGATALDVLGNDYDADGDDITIAALGPVSGGSAVLSMDHKWIDFTPNAGATSGSVVYSITDNGFGHASSTATAFLTTATTFKVIDYSANCSGVSCTFTALPQDPAGIRLFTWNFGDGTPAVTASSIDVQHNFPNLGAGVSHAYAVTVTADYYSGARAVMASPHSTTVAGLQYAATWHVEPHGLLGTFYVDSSTFPHTTATTRYRYYFSWPGEITGRIEITGDSHGSGYPSDAVNNRFPGSGQKWTELQITTETLNVSTGVWSLTDAYVNGGFIEVQDALPNVWFDNNVAADGRTFTFDPSRSDDDRILQEGSYEFAWDFGDGQLGISHITGSIANPITHAYAAPGAYNVTLKVTDYRNYWQSATKTVRVTVADLKPVPRFTFACAGLNCSFDGRASTDDVSIASYAWSFGDGTQSAGSTGMRQFAAAGCYQADLTVTDSAGQTATLRRTVSVTAQPLATAGHVVVDAHPIDGVTHSNLNGILEPGEIVAIEPVRTVAAGTITPFTGTLSSVDGSQAAATYTVADATASFQVVNNVSDCITLGDCYAAGVSANPRPAPHWDAFVHENAADGAHGYVVHIGGTYTDVPTTHYFYPDIEGLAHYGVAYACGTNQYCPDTVSSRIDFGVLLMQAVHRGPYTTPSCTTDPFSDTPCSVWYGPFINEMKQRGITSGCSATSYCGVNPTTRADAAVFITRALHTPGWVPPACTQTFADVQCVATPTTPKHYAADYISEFYRLGLTAGCSSSPLSFCPGDSITRGTAAAFLSRAFDLTVAYPQCPRGTPVSASATADETPQQ